MRAVGMKNYLTDRRFYSKECDFTSQGYPPNYGVNNYYRGGYSTIAPWTRVPAWDMGYCGTSRSPCELTFLHQILQLLTTSLIQPLIRKS